MKKPKPARRRQIELVPLKLFSRRIGGGWRMVPGYPLEPGDYAVLMRPPGWFDTTVKSNLSRAATSNNLAASARRRALENA